MNDCDKERYVEVAEGTRPSGLESDADRVEELRVFGAEPNARARESRQKKCVVERARGLKAQNYNEVGWHGSGRARRRDRVTGEGMIGLIQE